MSESEMKDKSDGVFRDSAGHKSSKRIAGTIILGVGAAFLLAVGIISISRVVADPDTSIRIGSTLIYTGAALLGVGVVEGLTRGGAK